jgi:hypothetical protein
MVDTDYVAKLESQLRRLCLCLDEAVGFASRVSPGTGHNAGMWATATKEAREALGDATPPATPPGELIPEANKAQFWMLEREAGEGMREYMARCWAEARGEAIPQDLPPARFQAEVVRDGYLSPYRFGKLLRALVMGAASVEEAEAADPVGVYAAKNVNTGGAVYYAWDGDNAEGDGPTRCAFYDPARGPTWGRQPATIDWYAAVDELAG